MSKRGAYGDHMRRDDMDSGFGMPGTPEEKPQRATAAQMANRKIKEVKRRPRGTTPTSGTESGGVFSSMPSAPSFTPSSTSGGFPAPSTQSTGFTFGQSQSFPGAGPASNSAGHAPSNPFSFNGNVDLQFSANNNASNNPFSFGSTPASQPAPSTGFSFGSSFGNNQPAQPTQTQPSFSFGAQPNTSSTSNGGLFGQQTTSNAPGDSMQMSPDSKPKQPVSDSSSSFPSRNIFGGSNASHLFSPEPEVQASNPFGGFKFSSGSSEKTSGDKQDGFAAKPGLAAQASSAPASTPTQPFSGLFGATSASEPNKASAAPSSTPSPAPFTFGAPKISEPASATATNTGQDDNQPKPFGSIFAGASSAASTPSIFSTAPKAPESVSASTVNGNVDQSKPFGSLFSGSSTSNQTAPPLFAPASQASNSVDSSKVNGQTDQSKPFGSLFTGSSSTSSAPQASFSFASATQKPSESTATNAVDASQDTSQPKPFGSLFTGASTPSLDSKTAFSSSTNSGNLFAPKSSEYKAPATSQTVSNIFAPKVSDSVPSNAASSTSDIFASTAPAKTGPPAPPAFGSKISQSTAPATALPAPTKPASSSSSSSLQEQIAGVHTPDFGEVSQEVKDLCEIEWKLRTLDISFKQQIAGIDPGTHAFDDIIAFYLRVRHALGKPLVLPKEILAPTAKQSTQSVEPAKPEPVKPTHNDEDHSATSNIFAKSFSTPVPASKVKTHVSATPPALQSTDNMFGNLKPAAGTAATSTENMFSNPKATTTPSGGIPKFGGGSAGVDFLAQFKKKAEANEAAEKAKRKAEDFDSDEDDEAEWERRDAEKQREKRAQYESNSNKKSVWVEGQGFKFVEASAGADTPTPPASGESNGASPTSTASIFESSSRPVSNSNNIFGRLSATPQPTEKDSDGSDDETKATSSKRRATNDSGSETTDDHTQKRPKSSEQETTKSSLDTPLPTPTAAASRSLFDRVESPAPQNDKTVNPFASLNKENSASANPFSSLNKDSSAAANPFASLSKETPKPANPFASISKEGSSAPAANPFAASLSKPSTSSSQSSLFGAATPTATPSFGAPANNTWDPNTPIKFSASGTASTTPTTAAPAKTETEPSGSAEGTEGGEDDTSAGSVFKGLANETSGEENEEMVYTCRARAFKLATGWTSQGTGVVKLLKHNTTGRSRILLRIEPNGNIALNTFLKKEFDYQISGNSVQLMVPVADTAAPEHWAIRMKPEFVKDFHAKIEEIKN